ncbi:DNRLRE domain-containing protein [bacterium]|nr:DNRLRE domain-containing protein [bacterium]
MSARIYILLFAVILMAHGAIPVRAATYYVATDSGASNSNAGTQDKPWRTITYAASKAVAGDTVKIKAGSYGREHVVVKNSGTASKPIVFEGYGGTVLLGTLDSPRKIPADTEIGFRIWGPDYITVRNLNFTWYYECFRVDESEYITCENLVCDKCGADGAGGSAIVYKYSNHGKILNCKVTDCGGNNVFLSRANYMLIDNLTSLGTLVASDTFCTDYYCVMRCCHDNVVQNSYAEDKAATNKGNHGFIIKDSIYTPNSYNNVIKDCTAKSFEECFSVAHLAYNNQFIRCHGDNSQKILKFNNVLNCRNGAHDNTFIDCDGVGDNILIGLSDYAETNYQTKYNNKFINCRLKSTGKTTSIGINYWNTQNTVFQNCVFDNANYFGRYIANNTGNSFKNCIVTGMKASYDPYALIGTGDAYYPWGNQKTPYNGTGDLSVTYTDFWNNSFSAFSGAGNMSADPKFANQSARDYHLKSKAGRWNGSAWVYDTEDSPLIDKGDQSSSYTNEPAPNGGRINIGGYGNTVEASKSSSGNNGPATPYDNRLCERYPTTVYASNTFLDVGHNAGYNKIYRDLIWFDLSPYSGSIKKATLSLYWYFPSSARTNSTIVDVYRPAYGWNHDYACWNNKSNGVAWTHAGGDWYDQNGTAQGSTPYASITFSASQAATNQYYAFDVTALVNEYLKSGQNAGFFIKAHTESDNYIAFYGLASTETAKLPKLEITKANPVPAEAWALYH